MASVADSLATAAAAIVAGLDLPGVTVRQRRKPSSIDGDSYPLVLVTVDEQDFEPATADDTGAWHGYYRLTATIIARKNAVQEGAPLIREWRQLIRRAMTYPALTAAGATHIDDCDPVAKPTFNRRGLDRSFDYSPVQFDVRTMEPR